MVSTSPFGGSGTQPGRPARLPIGDARCSQPDLVAPEADRHECRIPRPHPRTTGVAAIDALAGRASEPVVRELLRAAATGDADPEVRQVAQRALGGG